VLIRNSNSTSFLLQSDESYFIHLFDSRTLNMAALWMTPALLTAVSIHPLKNQDHMFRIHSFFKLRDHQIVSAELDELSDELKILV